MFYLALRTVTTVDELIRSFEEHENSLEYAFDGMATKEEFDEICKKENPSEVEIWRALNSGHVDAQFLLRQVELRDGALLSAICSHPKFPKELAFSYRDESVIPDAIKGSHIRIYRERLCEKMGVNPIEFHEANRIHRLLQIKTALVRSASLRLSLWLMAHARMLDDYDSLTRPSKKSPSSTGEGVPRRTV